MLKVGVVLSILLLSSCSKIDGVGQEGLVKDVEETKVVIMKVGPCNEERDMK